LEILKEISGLLSRVKIEKPLVHHITNYVTAADSANILLALGGTPVMADNQAEVEEVVSPASALVLNLGTLNPAKVEAMIIAGKRAKEISIPVVLDPVGVGATALRKNAANRILTEVGPTVIRGNMSEMRVIFGLKAEAKGVEALDTIAGGERLAVDLARSLGCVIGITGVKDVISDGRRISIIENGNDMLPRVTGTGCMSTSLIGAYSAVADDYYLSTVAGILTMGLAGDLALNSLKETEGIGTFRLRLFDSVGSLSEREIINEGKVSNKKIRL